MNVVLRKYDGNDFEAVSSVFRDTVKNVNIRDYSEEQCLAWIEKSECLKLRKKYLLRQTTLVAESGGEIIGFGSIDESGYLDLLFVHKNFQNRGVATLLCNELEKNFKKITVYSSLTAKLFFEKRGYDVIDCEYAVCSDVELKRFKMLKLKD